MSVYTVKPVDASRDAILRGGENGALTSQAYA